MGNNDRRRHREKQEMRFRILDAARELFAEGGAEAVALRRVAEKIEFSATAIYMHFPSKESLIEELCTADFDLFSRNFIHAERAADPLDRLRKVALTYADFGFRHPHHYRAMFMSPAGEFPSTVDPATGHPRSAKMVAYEFLYSAVFKVVAAGRFRIEHRDVPLVTQVIWSGVHGMVSLQLSRASFPQVNWRGMPTAVETLINLLLDGLTGGQSCEE